MTTETNITGTWTSLANQWARFTLWGAGATGADNGGAGGRGGFQSIKTVYVPSGTVVTITRGANGTHSQITIAAVVIAKAVGGGGLLSDCVGDTVTAGLAGSAAAGGAGGNGGAGGGVGGGAGGLGQFDDDGLQGTAPGGGGGGGAIGCLGNAGGIGRVDVTYPVAAPVVNQSILMGIASTILSSTDS